uniref:Uncharacterized protein n=1 Tax=Chenopodium quinoa TaxID=63459 RepID=A0A803MA36_CHEQI
MAAKKKDEEELNDLRGKIGKLKAAMDEINPLRFQLDEKSKAANRLPLVQKELDDAKGTIGLLEEKVQKMKAGNPGIRQRAVSRYLSSTDFLERLQDRYDGGWTAAQRCVVQVTGWTKPDWEAAFIERAHEHATGFEKQKFVEGYL